MSGSCARRDLRRFVALASVMATVWGCSAIEPMPGSGRRQGLLELDVVPKDAMIFIDDDYHGVVSSWTGQTVRLKPGFRRLELRAKGYYTQRFDVPIEAGEQLVLRVRLLPVLDEIEPAPRRRGGSRRR